MITLDKRFSDSNETIILEKDVLNSLPKPIYEAIQIIENEENPEKSLQILCFSLIPWTFQYFALIYGGEYLLSEHPPEADVTDDLMNMIRKPGPGKWVGFLRSSSSYFLKYPTQVIPEVVNTTFNNLLQGKSRPMVSNPESAAKMDYVESLINARNRFAHSRSIVGEKAKIMFNDYYLVWKALINIVSASFKVRLLYRPALDQDFQVFDNCELNAGQLPENKENYSLLWNPETNKKIKLFPVIISVIETNTANEALFLEEIKNKHIFYLHNDGFIKRKDEFLILIDLLDAKKVIPQEISSDELTPKILGERIDRVSNNTLMNYIDSKKYMPEMFVPRPSFSKKLDEWLASKKPACIIAGEPGVGKTSLIADWCNQQRKKGDHVLLFDTSIIESADVTELIEKELNLSSPLKDCFDSIHNQSKNTDNEQGQRHFIIVFDAINEFVGSENETRRSLWRKIDKLISILELYKPNFKCLLSTRSDLWKTDFPRKTSAVEILDEDLYWGDASLDFPVMVLGNLTITEAKEIYNKAREEIPSMEVLTSFDQLSEKTQKVLCNPFHLRMAMQTYNGEEMPDLTTSRLEKKYAKEKMLEEKEKKEVLFKLLERMSEFRKTELSLDEFIKGKKTKKGSTEREKLEKLVFDPRPDSPYKKLISDGILEERDILDGKDSEEKIKFSQEKITKIIYSEFQKRSLKRTFINAMLIFFVLSIMIFFVYSYLGYMKENGAVLIERAVSYTEIEADIKLQLIQDSCQLFELEWSKRTTTLVVFYIFLGVFVFLQMLLHKYIRLWIAKRMSIDLTSKFVKEKLNDKKQKALYYFQAPLIIPLIYLIYEGLNVGLYGGDMLQFVNMVGSIMLPILFFWIILADILAGAYVVSKNSKNPEDAYGLFGRKEVLFTFVSWVTTGLNLIILYFASIYGIEMLYNFLDPELLALKNIWEQSVGVQILQSDYHNIYNVLNELLWNPQTLREYYNLSIEIINILFHSVMIWFPIVFGIIILAQWRLGSILESYLKKRLGKT